MKAPAVIQGCGDTVCGNAIEKSLPIADRHVGEKNQPAGRNAVAAAARKATTVQLVTSPSEMRGGHIIKQPPNKVRTAPSAHFWVAPPTKQAKTGSSGTAR